MIKLTRKQAFENIQTISKITNKKIFDLFGAFDNYAIDEDGNVYNLNTYRKLKEYNSISKVKLKRKLNKTSYKLVKITNNNNELIQLSIHKLLSFAIFKEDCIMPLKSFENYLKRNRYVIDHIDNNKGNNKISNLQLLTNKQNCQKYNKEIYEMNLKNTESQKLNTLFIKIIKNYNNIHSKNELIKFIENNF